MCKIRRIWHSELVAYNKGEETGRYVNKDRKTQEQIEEFIEGLK